MNIYQHFRPEEREYIDRVLQWKEYVEQTYSPKLTDFLDPREQHILKVLIGSSADVKWELYGGQPDSERKRALLLPDYGEAKEEDFQIGLYEIEYPSKFLKIEHPQVLGSLMSLGLTRSKFGDILIKDNRAQFFVAHEVTDYVHIQLESIGRAKVSLKELPLKDAISFAHAWTEQSITVTSLRLDTVISGIHNISRQKSQLLIQQSLAKINWTTIENPSFDCAEGDLLSVRGYGRAKILSIEGKTKKDKWRMMVGVQK
ncbi:MAG: RNA-binding protein [Bacillota bacterium]|nr:RNA-binding protein [Bacillota bacterium]